MLCEDDHYCLKCGMTVSGMDSYIAHRSQDCSRPKKDIPVAPTNTPTEQFFSVLQLQRKSNVPVDKKATKVMVTRSKSKARDLGVDQRTSLPVIERVRGKPKKPKVDNEKSSERLADVEADDIWLDGPERRRIDCHPQGGGKNLPSEVFSMSPMYIPDLPEDKEVDKFLQDDYDESYYNFMDIDEIQYDPPPPRNDHKSGGKTGSPNPWLAWDAEEADPEETEGDGRSRRNVPPPTHTGGKWRPESGGKFKCSSLLESNGKCRSPGLDGKSLPSPDALSDGRYVFHPPGTHTGGKWRFPVAAVPEAGGKWKPPVSDQEGERSPTPGTVRKATDVEVRQRGRYPSPSHTSGKWTPEDPLAPPVEHTRGKWVPAGPTKCLKTSGGGVQYFCSPCGRRLASGEMYKKHLMSDLHVKRLLQEKDLECDGRSSRPLIKTEVRQQLVRQKKKPSRYAVEIKGRKKETVVMKRQNWKCSVCKMKVKKGRLGKHLISYYHYRRANLATPPHLEQILKNMHSIIRQSPYQCGPCHFYCNTPAQFQIHWLMEHSRSRRIESLANESYLWCSFCKFRCYRNKSMAKHLSSKEHRNVLTAINGSVPVVIRKPKEIKCRECGIDCRLNVNLRNHERTIHSIIRPKPERVHCPICSFSGLGQKSFRTHLRRKHPGAKVPFECSACNISFPVAKDMAEHRRTVAHCYNKILSSDDKDKKAALERDCSECEKRFESPADLIKHIEIEHPTKRHVCLRCGEAFACSQHVSLHTRMHCKAAKRKNSVLLSDKYSCNQPLQETSVASEFLCSQVLHNQQQQMIQAFRQCSFGCQWETDFLLHQTYHAPKTETGALLCPSCNLECSNMAKLRRHVVNHSMERKFSCSTCKSTFRLKQHLVQHRQYGTCGGEKEKRSVTPELRICNECGYAATTRQLLLRHLKTHEEARSFPCPECPFVAVLPDHLKRHLIVHTGAKPFKCPYCDYTCNLMENLRKHIRLNKRHFGKYIYQCWVCSFGTNLLSTFKRHLIGEHQEEGAESEINQKIKALFVNTNKNLKPSTYKPKKRRKPESERKPVKAPIPIIMKRPVAKMPPESYMDVEYLEEEDEEIGNNDSDTASVMELGDPRIMVLDLRDVILEDETLEPDLDDDTIDEPIQLSHGFFVDDSKFIIRSKTPKKFKKLSNIIVRNSPHSLYREASTTEDNDESTPNHRQTVFIYNVEEEDVKVPLVCREIDVNPEEDADAVKNLLQKECYNR